MQIKKVFVTVNVADHAALIDWWTKAFGRSFDATPVPNCREWNLTPTTIFQVIEAARANGPVEVAFLVDDVERERDRLTAVGIALSEPVDVPGFVNLKWSRVLDPEGNKLSLLSGA